MFLPGGLFSGALLPWILFAPALPLLAAMMRRPVSNASFISLLICTVVSLLTGIFNYLAADGQVNQHVFHFTLFLDMASAFTLLYIHSSWPKLQQIILPIGLLYAGIFLTLILVGKDNAGLEILVGIGYALIFFGSIAVMLSQMQHISSYITVSPTFWICAGLCFHYGLTSLLVWLNPHQDAANLISDEDFGVIYTIILLLRYIFFSAAVFLYKSLSSSNPVRR